MKKNLFLFLFLSSILLLSSCADDVEEFDDNTKYSKSELDNMFLSKWSVEKKTLANTASAASYLSNEEKEIYFYLNLVRIDPPLFAETYLSAFEGDEGFTKGYAFDERKKSLIKQLQTLKPLPLIYPDKNLYNLAHCFALEGGKLGLVGHDRTPTGCPDDNISECIQYGGAKNGLSIVLSLLIDSGKNNAELGHRKICLERVPYIMGASIEAHTKYKFNAVLDFKIDPNR